MLIMTETGLPIYSAPLEDALDIDESILSGFLSALHSFGKETAGEISSMNLGTLAINFLNKNRLLFVIAHDQSIAGNVIRRLLEEISDLFLSQYQELLQQSALLDSTLFLDFKNDFNSVLAKYKKIEDLPVFYGDINNFNGIEKEIFVLCDGTRTIREIAEEIEKVYFDVMQVIVKHKGNILKIHKKPRWRLD